VKTVQNSVIACGISHEQIYTETEVEWHIECNVLRPGWPRNHVSAPGRGKGFFIFCFTKHPDQLCGPSSFGVHWILGALSLAVKWLGHAAECSPSSSVKVNVCRAVSAHPSVCSWHARGQLYLYLLFAN